MYCMYQVIYNELPNNKVPYEFYVKQLGSELWIRIRIRQNDTHLNTTVDPVPPDPAFLYVTETDLRIQELIDDYWSK